MVLLLLLTMAMGTGAAEIEELRQESQQDLQWFANEVDSILGGTRTDDRKSTSTLRFSASESTSRFAKQHDPHLGVRFILKLAVLNQWRQELRGWWRDKIKKTSPTGPETTKTGGERAAEKEVNPDDWQFSIDKRFILARRVNYWFHLRVRKDFHWASWLHTFATEAGWSRSQKWRSYLTTGSTRKLTQRLGLGWNNVLTWAMSEKSFSTSHGPALSYLFPHRGVLVGSLALDTAIVDRAWGTSAYAAATQYRLEVKRDGFYVALGGSLSFAREHHFAGDPGATANIEVLF